MELIKKTGNNSLEALGQAFRRPLIAALQAQDSQAINRELKLFKNTDGSPKMEMVLAIQRDNRITEMAAVAKTCLLYTYDASDEGTSVDLGGSALH